MRDDEIFKPVTLLSENELGQIGSEEWPALTVGMIRARVKELSARDWEVQEIQVGESQSTLYLEN